MTTNSNHIDTTTDFENELNTWRQAGGKWSPSDAETDLLMVYAEGARTASRWTWGALRAQLIQRCDMGVKEAAEKVRRVRIKADLGTYPHTGDELIPAWLAARGYRMDFHFRFEGTGGVLEDINFVTNELRLWCEDFGHLGRQAEPALQNFMTREFRTVWRDKFADLRHDPAEDPNRDELRRLVNLIVADGETAEDTARDRLAAETVLANFIHRVKNHIGGFAGIRNGNAERWHHWSHVMPVLFGGQGCGKTRTVDHLLSPLGPMASGASFDLLEKQFQIQKLADTPVLFFDELGGVTKAEVEKVKAVMTERVRNMDRKNREMTVRTIVSTFIGCTNRDLRMVMRDETGNRRFLQIAMKPKGTIDLRDIEGIDMLKVWRSVDEDAAAPYSTGAMTSVVTAQEGQRHKDAVAQFVDDLAGIAADHVSGSSERRPGTGNVFDGLGVNLMDGRSYKVDMWWQAFRAWLEANSPLMANRWERHAFAIRFASETTGVLDSRKVHNANAYSAKPEHAISRDVAAVVPFRPR